MAASAKQRVETLDWQQVRDRLGKACAALEQRQALSPERARAILEERARVLARVPPQTPAAMQVVEVLIFALGKERYAIETAHVREVLRVQEIAPLPETPDYLLGVTNLRGQILPVFDLREFFGLGNQGPADQTRILVLGTDRPDLGVLADAVFEVARLRIEEILEPPGSAAGIAREYLRGVTAQALIVLDGSVLLQDARLFIDQGETSAAAVKEGRS